MGNNFLLHVNNPSSYGVLELDSSGKLLKLEEKPIKQKSNWAVTCLYYFKNNVIKIAKSLSPSERGELEVTDLINHYLKSEELESQMLGRGFA